MVIEKAVLTGFMGVGKSTVARELASRLKYSRLDVDWSIEKREGKTVAEIVEAHGIERFREMETEALAELLDRPGRAIIALGGGAWIQERNRQLIKEKGCASIWLEASFDHCWANIRNSKRVRPLAKDKESARKLFEDRLSFYCLAEWHFVLQPGLSSADIAHKIAEQVFGVE